jgi:regulatory protein YycH of two-component signal transduction system YycFG
MPRKTIKKNSYDGYKKPRTEAKKTTKKRATASKKKALDKMSQTHGMAEKEEYQPTTLNQIFGDDGGWKYKTLETNEYKHYLSGMNRSDLQSHAIEIGIIPIDNREQLTKRLVREFNRHVMAYKKPVKKSVDVSNVSQDVLDILAEGR